MMDILVESKQMKMAECRICHDADEDSNMEMPCSCRGTLKYAHRECVQRWCNEKGDTICEICRQNFKPDYTAPSPLLHYGGFPINMRGNWEISMNDLDAFARSYALAYEDPDFLYYEFDEYSVMYPRSLICCRIVAITFVLLLMLRTMLPILLTVAGDYTITSVMFLVLKTVGILLAICTMVKALLVIRHQRHQQDPYRSHIAQSDEETDQLPFQQRLPPLIVRLHEENDLPLQPPPPQFICPMNP